MIKDTLREAVEKMQSALIPWRSHLQFVRDGHHQR